MCVQSGDVSEHVRGRVARVIKRSRSSGSLLSSEPEDAVLGAERERRSELGSGLFPPNTLMTRQVEANDAGHNRK